jgi:hypothetical protein
VSHQLTKWIGDLNARDLAIWGTLTVLVSWVVTRFGIDAQLAWGVTAILAAIVTWVIKAALSRKKRKRWLQRFHDRFLILAQEHQRETRRRSRVFDEQSAGNYSMSKSFRLSIGSASAYAERLGDDLLKFIESDLEAGVFAFDKDGKVLRGVTDHWSSHNQAGRAAWLRNVSSSLNAQGLGSFPAFLRDAELQYRDAMGASSGRFLQRLSFLATHGPTGQVGQAGEEQPSQPGSA